MCLVALAWKAHPRWRLLLAGNRDEFHERPTAPLAQWAAPAERVLAGRDTTMDVAEAQKRLAESLAQLQALERLRRNLKH